LWEKFGVGFSLYTAALDLATRINIFKEHDLHNARHDQLPSHEELHFRPSSSPARKT